MNIEDFRQYCLSLPGVTESFPFDDITLVFKVMDKMFSLTSLDGDFRINLKCDPEKALELREKFDAVIPGYHMSKQHWNTIIMDGSIGNDLIIKWINDSYGLIVSKLTKIQREKLALLS